MTSSKVAEVSHYPMLRMPKPHLMPHQPWGDTRDSTKAWPERIPGAKAQRSSPSSLERSLACSEGLRAASYMDPCGPDWDLGGQYSPEGG